MSNHTPTMQNGPWALFNLLPFTVAMDPTNIHEGRNQATNFKLCNFACSTPRKFVKY